MFESNLHSPKGIDLIELETQGLDPLEIQEY